jgi:hypothetical protein
MSAAPERALRLALLALLALLLPPQRSAAQSCRPEGGLHFVCGAPNPEDLALIPRTRWLIATGFAPGAGLKLVDTRSRTLAPWRPAVPATSSDPRCPVPLDPARLNAHGLSLRARGDGRFTLHVVGHGGREAVEVFEVDARADRPVLTWTGCLPMPEGLAANSVATFSDGTVLATVLTRPGTTIADFVAGRITGGVWQWAPGDDAFRLLPGTELPGNNGLETSRDDRQFYVVAFGWHAVVAFARGGGQPLMRAVAPDFMPDNIHWDGGRLVAAGMRYDEPACGGVRGVAAGVADPMTCHRGFVAASFDPAAGAFRTIAYAPPNAAFNDVSSAVMVGDELWLGSFRSDRLAWMRLPQPRRRVARTAPASRRPP